MRIGISTWVWTSPATTAVLERLIPHIAAMGYDAVEIPVEGEDQFDVDRVRDLIEAHGLAVYVCAVIGPGRDLLLPDEYENGMAYLRMCIDVARRLGAPTVAGPLYSAVGRCWQATPAERANDVERLAGRLRVLGDYAAERGVALGLEPLNRFETSFLNTVQQALELVNRIDHPAVGLSLDLFHMGIEEKSPADALRTAGHYLKNVQVAENDRGTPGTGHLPWTDVARALEDIGYTGPVIIETFSNTVEAIARAAAIWRPLAPDSDTLAKDGLRFLRGLFAEEPLLDQTIRIP